MSHPLDASRRTPCSLTLAFAAMLAAAACTGKTTARDSTTSTPDAQASATPAAEPARRELDWCALLPVQEVSATLQRTVGKGVSVTRPSAGGGCSYRDVEQGAPDMQLLIEAVDVESDSAATESMSVVRGMFKDRGQAVTDVAGIGDAAFGAWEAETYGIKFRKARYTGQVNVNARRFKDPAVEQAAQELAKQVVAKLP